MTVSIEARLALLIVALYLKDCVRLLNLDEAVLMSRGGTRWTAGFGARSWRIAGKEPFIANPFLPDQAVFRLRWHMTPIAAKAASAARTPVRIAQEVRGVAYLAWLTWVDLFVVLPICLLGRLGPTVTMAAIALLYASIVASLALVWVWKGRLAVDARAFAVLAFECLACPPYGANIVRKLSELQRADEDFETAAKRLLASEPLSEARLQCLVRLEEQMERVGDEDPNFESLRQTRVRFLPAGEERS